MHGWLARVRHDLLKHAAWRARDLREAMTQGLLARGADVAALRSGLLALPDEEGRPVGAVMVWRGLRSQLDPADTKDIKAALEGFDAAVVEAEAKIRALSDEASGAAAACEAVLALDEAFDRMARDVKLARMI